MEIEGVRSRGREREGEMERESEIDVRLEEKNAGERSAPPPPRLGSRERVNLGYQTS